MIIGVFGLPGAGKTTFLTCAAQHWLKGKYFMGIAPSKTVFTNFLCDGCYKLDFDKLGLYNFSDCNILIDEIMLLADTRNFKTFPEHLKQFFALHRKSLGDNHGVIWCSQYYDDCDKKIRVLTHKYYLLQKGVVFPFFSYVKPIIREMKPKKGSMNDSFILGAPATWRVIYRPHWYTNFDSYETALRALPPVPLIPWVDTSPKVDSALEKWRDVEQGVSP